MKPGLALAGVMAIVGVVALANGQHRRGPSDRASSSRGTVSGTVESTPATELPAVAVPTYQSQAALPVYRAPEAFHGYECTVDCSGHEAGYDWAERHSIEDPDDCGGNSQSFIEGCQAYAREQQGETADDGDADKSGSDDDS